MRKILIIAVLLATSLLGAKADVDPNFYVYICFGQSNMEGNAQPDPKKDKANVDKRFRLLATCNYSSPQRTMGQWYDAIPPLVNPVGGLGPTDYFGRTMVAALPANVRIGVIPVAMGGSPIEMFDKDKYKQKLQSNPNEWWAQIAKNNYGGNPYGRIIDMAKKAQEVGVIKGILLHQGCSNNGDPNWPGMVKKIYNDMLNDLGLAADTVPLFVGETLRQENGGACYGHNVQVDRMPSVVPTSHVVSSEGLPGNGQDPWHFNATGYRILGKRYAFEALKLMGQELIADPDYQMSSQLKEFYEAKSISLEDNVLTMPGQKIPVTAKFVDGHTEDVSDFVRFTSDNLPITDGIIASEGEGDATAVYTDFSRKETTKDVHVVVKYFPFKSECIKSLKGTLVVNEAEQSLKVSASGQAGWVYENGADMSAYKYLVLKLKQKQTCGAALKFFAQSTPTGTSCSRPIRDSLQVVVELQNLKSGSKTINPAHIGIVGFYFSSSGTIYIEDIFLTNDDSYSPTGIAQITASDSQKPASVYTLDGRRLSQPTGKGIYIQRTGNNRVSKKIVR